MMKNTFRYITAVSLILLSFGCTVSDSDPVNTAPSVPTLVSPSNGQFCISNTLDFQWNAATDSEGDAVSYQLEIAADNQFTQIAATRNNISGLLKKVALEKGKTYYWRVKAIDSNNLSSEYSTISSFYTEGSALTNNIPFLPQLVTPVLDGSISGNTVMLQWTATDADASDVLTFDVYLDTNSTPVTKVGNNINTKSLQVNTLESAKTYYWQVVVKDNKGGETNGPVWKFNVN